jgi:hypothetical protein
MMDLPIKKIFVFPVIMTARCEIEFASRTAFDLIILALQAGFVQTALPEWEMWGIRRLFFSLLTSASS